MLGDPRGANSIGKSTLLLLVDFAFGGSDLEKVIPDLTGEGALGHHYYDLTLRFGSRDYTFRRTTSEPGLVAPVNRDGTLGEAWKLDDYTSWLRDSYALAGAGLTFRASVSPFSRVWKRETLDAQKPLHSINRQPDADAVTNLLKLFQRYEKIQSLEGAVQSSQKRKDATTSAEKAGLLRRVTATERTRNIAEIRTAEAELQSIRSDLALYAANISQILNRDVLALKQEKDALLRRQLHLQSRLRRIEQNLTGVRAARKSDFLRLQEFFPDIDMQRLSTVESFHAGISEVLRLELRSAKTSLESELKDITSRLDEIDSALRKSLRNVDQPERVIDRVIEVATELRTREEENAAYDDRVKLDSDLAAQKAALRATRQREADEVAKDINTRIEELAERILPEGRRAPVLVLEPNRYRYEVERDTGTGTAFAAVVLLDVAILRLSQLPYIIHDSVMFKNVDPKIVSRMIDEYATFQKQVFVALDETRKYGPQTADRLHDGAVARLTNENLLFNVDWRSRDAP